MALGAISEVWKTAFASELTRSGPRTAADQVFSGMLFGVGIAAVGAAAFSLGAHHNGSAPASPGPTRETAAPASARKSGQR
jgi:hypothetical protein